MLPVQEAAVLTPQGMKHKSSALPASNFTGLATVTVPATFVFRSIFTRLMTSVRGGAHCAFAKSLIVHLIAA